MSNIRVVTNLVFGVLQEGGSFLSYSMFKVVIYTNYILHFTECFMNHFQGLLLLNISYK